jgi:hypothetical protein
VTNSRSSSPQDVKDPARPAQHAAALEPVRAAADGATEQVPDVQLIELLLAHDDEAAALATLMRDADQS